MFHQHQNIETVDTLHDPVGLIRACGNLGPAFPPCSHVTLSCGPGNTYELLGDFATAAEFHLKRLKIAQDVRSRI